MKPETRAELDSLVATIDDDPEVVREVLAPILRQRDGWKSDALAYSALLGDLRTKLAALVECSAPAVLTRTMIHEAADELKRRDHHHPVRCQLFCPHADCGADLVARAVCGASNVVLICRRCGWRGATLLLVHPEDPKP